MKNKLFILLVTTVMSIMTGIAQEENRPVEKKITFGIRGGVNGSYIGDIGEDFFSSELYGGIFTETRLSKKWSIQNELNVSFSGDFIFVEIPILLKYNFSDKLSILAGPRLDVNAKPKHVTFSSPLGISAELGIQYNINKHLFIEARYDYGFTNSSKIFGNNLVDANNFRVGLGFKF